jgi:hypothetical protein
VAWQKVEDIINVSLPTLAISALLLTGCIATTSGYQQMVNSWVGAPESALIAQLGPPSGVYSSGGFKYLTFVASGAAYRPPVAPSYTTTVIGNTAYTSPFGGSAGFPNIIAGNTNAPAMLMGWKGAEAVLRDAR